MNDASGTVTSGPSESEAPAKPNYNEIADNVWPHIKRKLRLERERERGLPS